MRKRNAFTLVELLVVIGVIAILSAITFGIASGVYQRQARSTAQAELAALSAALDAYKLEHEGYPEATGTAWSGENGERLFQALTGQIDPNNVDIDGRSFVDVSKFTLQDEENASEISANNLFIDPWGTAYVYQYDADQSAWNRYGFVLLSAGPDGQVGAIENGIVDEDDPLNTDNIVIN